MTRSALLFLSVIVMFLPMIANAQVYIGDLVRVGTVDDRMLTGTVSEVTGNGIGIRSMDGFSASISYDEMESLHRSVGRGSYAARTALIGGGSAALSGLLIGAVTGNSCDDAFDDDSCSSLGLFVGVVFAVPLGLVGALVGLIAGSSIKREKWQKVPLTDRGTMSIEPRISIPANGLPSFGVQLVF